MVFTLTFREGVDCPGEGHRKEITLFIYIHLVLAIRSKWLHSCTCKGFSRCVWVSCWDRGLSSCIFGQVGPTGGLWDHLSDLALCFSKDALLLRQLFLLCLRVTGGKSTGVVIGEGGLGVMVSPPACEESTGGQKVPMGHSLAFCEYRSLQLRCSNE